MELKEAWKLVFSIIDDAIVDHQIKLYNLDSEHPVEDSLTRYKQAVEMLEEVYQADMQVT